jgi:hypothetical protein
MLDRTALYQLGAMIPVPARKVLIVCKRRSENICTCRGISVAVKG